jgi:hypothetical protein
LSGQINAAGIAATYAATFADGEQLRIVEQRADSRSGEYEFRGARLLHYSGAGAAPAQEISAIRERAQLLRSHALAQQTTRDHH